jgi:hypothetical protein
MTKTYKKPVVPPYDRELLAPREELCSMINLRFELRRRIGSDICMESYHCAVMSRLKLALSPISVGFLLCLFFVPEDGDGMLLRIVDISPNYTALQPRILSSS